MAPLGILRPDETHGEFRSDPVETDEDQTKETMTTTTTMNLVPNDDAAMNPVNLQDPEQTHHLYLNALKPVNKDRLKSGTEWCYVMKSTGMAEREDADDVITWRSRGMCTVENVGNAFGICS